MQNPFDREMTDKELTLYEGHYVPPCSWCRIFQIPVEPEARRPLSSLGEAYWIHFWRLIRLGATVAEDQVSLHWALDLALRRLIYQQTGQDVPTVHILKVAIDAETRRRFQTSVELSPDSRIAYVTVGWDDLLQELEATRPLLSNYQGQVVLGYWDLDRMVPVYWGESSESWPNLAMSNKNTVSLIQAGHAMTFHECGILFDRTFPITGIALQFFVADLMAKQDSGDQYAKQILRGLRRAFYLGSTGLPISEKSYLERCRELDRKLCGRGIRTLKELFDEITREASGNTAI